MFCIQTIAEVYSYTLLHLTLKVYVLFVILCLDLQTSDFYG